MLALPDIGKNVLAIDPGTRMGWALLAGDTITSGVHVLPTGPTRRRGLRWESLSLFLTRTHLDNSISVLAFEESRWSRNVDAMLDHGGFLATLILWAYRNGVRVEPATPGQIKKHSTGSGGAGKALVINAMQLRGHDVSDDNEADALALLDLTIWKIHSKSRAA
jgi:Holliday junction resolvasome RuvABC endonuclease subunit